MPTPGPQGPTNIPGVNDVKTAYAHETELARSLALNQGKLWEFLLIEELLKTKFDSFQADWGKSEAEVQKSSRLRFTGSEFTRWVSTQSEQLSGAVTNIGECLQKRLLEAIGQPGIPGHPIEILAVVNSFFENCRLFLRFETAIRAAEVPPPFEKLRNCFRGITVTTLHVAEDLKNQWIEKTDALKNGATAFHLNVSFETPPQAALATKELARIRKHPEWLRE